MKELTQAVALIERDLQTEQMDVEGERVMLANVDALNVIVRDVPAVIASRDYASKALDEATQEIVKLREALRRDNILTAAMAEIYATLQGRSSQPIASIVDGCRAELCRL